MAVIFLGNGELGGGGVIIAFRVVEIFFRNCNFLGGVHIASIVCSGGKFSGKVGNLFSESG